MNLCLHSKHTTSSPFLELSHCGDNTKLVYLDIVTLIDQSTSMGSEGTNEVIKVTVELKRWVSQFTSYFFTAMDKLTINTPEKKKDAFYSRLSVMQFNNKTANVCSTQPQFYGDSYRMSGASRGMTKMLAIWCWTIPSLRRRTWTSSN